MRERERDRKNQTKWNKNKNKWQNVLPYFTFVHLDPTTYRCCFRHLSFWRDTERERESGEIISSSVRQRQWCEIRDARATRGPTFFCCFTSKSSCHFANNKKNCADPLLTHRTRSWPMPYTVPYTTHTTNKYTEVFWSWTVSKRLHINRKTFSISEIVVI